MEKRETLEIGNNRVEAESKFTDGYCNGNLYYYDTNHQLPRPLTGEAICSLMLSNLTDQRATTEWNAGFIFGWIAALCENNLEFFFTSIIIPESAIETEPLQNVALREA